MKKKKELKFYATKKRSKQSLQPEEQGFLTTSIQANHQPTPHYQTSRPSHTKTTKIVITQKQDIGITIFLVQNDLAYSKLEDIVRSGKLELSEHHQNYQPVKTTDTKTLNTVYGCNGCGGIGQDH